MFKVENRERTEEQHFTSPESWITHCVTNSLGTQPPAPAHSVLLCCRVYRLVDFPTPTLPYLFAVARCNVTEPGNEFSTPIWCPSPCHRTAFMALILLVYSEPIIISSPRRQRLAAWHSICGCAGAALARTSTNTTVSESASTVNENTHVTCWPRRGRRRQRKAVTLSSKLGRPSSSSGEVEEDRCCSEKDIVVVRLHRFHWWYG